jgi:hypothetical protein
MVMGLMGFLDLMGAAARIVPVAASVAHSNLLFIVRQRSYIL